MVRASGLRYRSGMKRVALMLGTLVACAPKAESDAGESTSGGGTSGSTSSAATTAMLDGSGTGSASASSTTGGDASTSAGADDFPGTDDGAKLDLPPSIATCSAADSELVDLGVLGTPDGQFAAMHAWWGWENCCDRDPWIVLSTEAPLQIGQGGIDSPYVFGYVFGESGHTGPFVGPQTLALGTQLPSTTATFETGFELLEPLDPDAPPEGEQPRISATFAIEGDGWSVQGSVQALYCPALETEPCPCE